MTQWFRFGIVGTREGRFKHSSHLKFNLELVQAHYIVSYILSQMYLIENPFEAKYKLIIIHGLITITLLHMHLSV